MQLAAGEKNNQGLVIDSAGKLPDGKTFSTPAQRRIFSLTEKLILLEISPRD